MLDELSKNNIWMMDGTFKVAPTLFLQLYTIHVIIGGPNGHVFPCIYALLPNKTTQTYIKLFQILKDARPNLAPHLCIMDFELASKRALLTVFPQVSVAGCFFHLTQAVWRKVQVAGLTENYINQPEVREAVKSLCALAFLDVENVNEAFEQLQEYVEQIAIEGLTDLYDYFEDTYRVGQKDLPVVFLSLNQKRFVQFQTNLCATSSISSVPVATILSFLSENLLRYGQNL